MTQRRTQEWLDMRRQVAVTGSTLHRTIGMDGIKRLNENFDEKVNDAEPQMPSTEVQQAIDHGTDNESNMIGALVSKVLPIFSPYMVYRVSQKTCPFSDFWSWGRR